MQENKWECKICMEEAKEAVVTKCGHLFCWSCIYEWAQAKQSNTIPCPLCQAEVVITETIPLYTTSEQH
jgi:E3 ubiquitin-protein ligase RNF5